MRRPKWLRPADLRGAALFRITFGLATLSSVVDIAPVLPAGFSDEGFWPRSAALAGVVTRLSLMDVSGPPWIAYGYWLLEVVACVCFIVGWHSRLSTLALFLLASGMEERNLGIFDSSDDVIRVLLFWSLFLPVGNSYSVDAFLARTKGRPLPTDGNTFVLRLVRLQFAWIYLCTFLCKLPGEAWRNGTAVHIALGLEHYYTRQLGEWMRNMPSMTTAATYLTLLVEGAFLPLVFAPILQPHAKAVALLSGFALHCGIWVTMCIGGFSWVMVAAYPLLFEPRWVDWTVGLASPLGDRLRGWGASYFASSRRSSPFASPAVHETAACVSWPGPLPADVVDAARWAGRAALAALLAACLWSTPPLAQRVRIPERLASFIQTIELWQTWTMFAPDPPAVDVEMTGEGNLHDGAIVDVLRGDVPPGPLGPPRHGFFSSRWMYVRDAIAWGDSAHLAEFAHYLCRHWNRADRPGGRPLLSSFRLSRIDRTVPPRGNTLAPPQVIPLWEQACE